MRILLSIGVVILSSILHHLTTGNTQECNVDLHIDDVRNMMIDCNQTCEGARYLPDGTVCYIICQSWGSQAKEVPAATCELCGTCRGGTCVKNPQCESYGR
ncbi:uncharacterized protein LOC142574357 [Dermacentor variabilis]|uniref:uncharacterized protein LOC142574357 n=1 Tax=Dermacentor variabilis TaxID=34621 RepID=UPI003F5B24F4